jgi:hypothetical protein
LALKRRAPKGVPPAGGALPRIARTEISDVQTVRENDIQGIYEFIRDAEIVEGPGELLEIVSELWPDLLHKLKPPKSLMH